MRPIPSLSLNLRFALQHFSGIARQPPSLKASAAWAHHPPAIASGDGGRVPTNLKEWAIVFRCLAYLIYYAVVGTRCAASVTSSPCNLVGFSLLPLA